MAFSSVLCLLLSVAVYCVWTLGRNFDKQQQLSLALYTTSSVVPPSALLVFRVFCATIIWSLNAFLLFDSGGLKLDVQMRDGTNKKVFLKHGERFTPFTVWCWVCQGLYFGLAVLLSLSHEGYVDLKQYTPLVSSTAHILFEISFATAFLVSAVVTYVLIPATIKRKLPLDNFFMPLPKIMHNANVVFISMELILNKIDFNFSHHPYLLFYAMAYVVFAWAWFEVKGLFYYFFLDYVRPDALAWHVALLVLLLACFAAGYLASTAVHAGSVPATVALLIGTFLVIKVK